MDFPYLLFADQLGMSVQPGRGRPVVRWIRLITDVPTGILEILGGRQDWQTYLRSLRQFDVESVFSREDPSSGLAELALLPYASMKRGFYAFRRPGSSRVPSSTRSGFSVPSLADNKKRATHTANMPSTASPPKAPLYIHCNCFSPNFA